MKNRLFLLSVALVAAFSIALNQQGNPIVSWFSPAATAEAQATSRTFAGEGGDAARFFFIEKGIKPFQDGVAIDDTPLTTQKICELAGYSRVAYLTTRSFRSCGDNFVETWDGSAWVRSGACATQPYIDTLTCDTPIVPVAADLTVSKSAPTTTAFGNIVTFSTTVSNLGPSAATSIVVTETIPSGLDWFSTTVTGSGVTCSSTLGTTTCTIPTLNAGQSITYGLSYGFVISQICPSPLQTKATVTSATPDSNASNNTSNTVVTNVTNCPVPNSCRQAVFDASYGSLTSQGWTALDPGQDQSATVITENGITFLRINDQSTARGLRTEFTGISDSALADRDWNLEMKARVISSEENGYTLGMNMLLASPAGKYASIYIDTDKFGPIGTSINQYNYARTYSANTTNGFHTYAIKYKKNGAGVNDDTFDVLFDGQIVMANVARTEIWDSGVWNQNINGISFGVGSSPGQAQMDVVYVRFNNTDSNNCASSSSSSSSSSAQCLNPTVINFDDVNGSTQNGHWATGTFITNQYSNKGVVFSSNGQAAIATNYSDLGTLPSNALVGNNLGSGFADSYYPITMDITQQGGASSVEVTLVSVGSAGVSVTAYNSNGQIVDSLTRTGNGNGGLDRQTVRLNGSNISRVTFARINNAIPHEDGFAIDDVKLTYANDCASSSSSSIPSGQSCNDNIDNDNDGQIDINDPGCHTDRNRYNPMSYNPNGNEFDNNRGYTCQDGVDNNNNGYVDAQDPICHTDGNRFNNASYNPNGNEGFGSSSSSSSSSNGNAQCSNGYDDDADSLIDGNDPGCHTDRNRYNPASYNPNGTENGNDRTRGCQDGVDNNGNGLIDAQDPVCHTDGNPNNSGSFDPSRNEDGGNNQGNGCIIVKTEAEDQDGDRIKGDLDGFTVTVDGNTRTGITDDDGEVRFNNLATGSHYVNMQLNGDWELDDVSPNNGNVTLSGSSCKTVTFSIVENDDNDDNDNNDDAEIDVRKTASSSEVFPGGTIEYTITIENTGDVDLEDLVVEDRIPSDLVIIDDGDADEKHGNTLTWNIDIDEGDTETISYRVSVPAYSYPGQSIRNDVNVTSDDNDIDIDESSSAYVMIIGTLPQTGVMGSVTGSASAYLTPMSQSAGSTSSGGSAAALIVTVLTGIGGGISFGRKYLMGL